MRIETLKVTEIGDELTPASMATDINDLIESIKKEGLLNRIIVRYTDGNYYIVNGRQRLRAIQYLGIKEIDCYVLDQDPVIAAMEGVQKVLATPGELGKQLDRLLKDGHTFEDIATKSGMTIAKLRHMHSRRHEA